MVIQDQFKMPEIDEVALALEEQGMPYPVIFSMLMEKGFTRREADNAIGILRGLQNLKAAKERIKKK